MNDRNLIEMARERGHEQIAQMLEQARERRGRVAAHPPITRFIGQRRSETRTPSAPCSTPTPRSLNRRIPPRHHAAPLRRPGGSREMVNLLLDRGANIHARNPEICKRSILPSGAGAGNPSTPTSRGCSSHAERRTTPVAAALGDLSGVRQMLDETRRESARRAPAGGGRYRPQSNSVMTTSLVFCSSAARIRDGTSPSAKRQALHAASRMGNLAMVKRCSITAPIPTKTSIRPPAR